MRTHCSAALHPGLLRERADGNRHPAWTNHRSFRRGHRQGECHRDCGGWQVSVETTTSNQGTYEFKGLTPGSYTVTAIAKGFAADQESDVEVSAGQAQELDIGLEIAVEQQQVEVQEDTPTVGVSPENSAGTLVLKGKDLDALVGRSRRAAVGAGSPRRTLGRTRTADRSMWMALPPDSFLRSRPSARSVSTRIPSPRNMTSWATDESKSSPSPAPISCTANSWSTATPRPSMRSIPLSPKTPGYYSEIFNGNISGPIGKKASFFFTVQQRNIDNVSRGRRPGPEPATITSSLTTRPSPVPRRGSTSARASISSSRRIIP